LLGNILPGTIRYAQEGRSKKEERSQKGKGLLGIGKGTRGGVNPKKSCQSATGEEKKAVGGSQGSMVLRSFTGIVRVYQREAKKGLQGSHLLKKNIISRERARCRKGGVSVLSCVKGERDRTRPAQTTLAIEKRVDHNEVSHLNRSMRITEEGRPFPYRSISQEFRENLPLAVDGL